MGLAEMIGTAIFVGLGCGSIVQTMTGHEPTHLNSVITFAFGISTAIIVSYIKTIKWI